MAFYHVGGCDCPMGCCDCGSTNSLPPKKKKRRTKDEIISDLKYQLKMEKMIRKSDNKHNKYYNSLLAKTVEALISNSTLKEAYLELNEKDFLDYVRNKGGALKLKLK